MFSQLLVVVAGLVTMAVTQAGAADEAAACEVGCLVAFPEATAGLQSAGNGCKKACTTLAVSPNRTAGECLSTCILMFSPNSAQTRDERSGCTAACQMNAYRRDDAAVAELAAEVIQRDEALRIDITAAQEARFESELKQQKRRLGNLESDLARLVKVATTELRAEAAQQREDLQAELVQQREDLQAELAQQRAGLETAIATLRAEGIKRDNNLSKRVDAGENDNAIIKEQIQDLSTRVQVIEGADSRLEQQINDLRNNLENLRDDVEDGFSTVRTIKRPNKAKSTTQATTTRRGIYPYYEKSGP